MKPWLLAGMAALAACMTPIAIGSAPEAPSPAPAAPASGGSSASPQVQELARLLNEHRRARGCPELVWLDAAGRAAQAHSADMARRGYFDHVSPEGQGPDARLADQGITFSWVAENIAMTSAGARDALRLWLSSASHRTNLETCALTHHGVGLSGAYWTHVLLVPG